MATGRRERSKNVAAQHHDEMAAEHDQRNHRLDAEHRQPTMPAHRRETREIHQEHQREKAPGGDSRAAESGSGNGRSVPKAVGSTVQVAKPHHLSTDDPNLDAIDAASADSFPTSDPPSHSSPSRIG
jgi:hypothetical protein